MDNYQDNKDKSINLLPFFILFSIPFFPGLIYAAIFYFVFFRKLKLRPSISILVVLAEVVILLIVTRFLPPLSDGVLSFRFWIFLNAVYGIVVGYLLILFQASRLKKYPELVYMKGPLKDFKYAKTPWKHLKKKRLIKKCASGKALSDEGAPIGVLDEPVMLEEGEVYDGEQIVYRYYADATTHTLMTGSTGSGKTSTMLNLVRNDIEAGIPVCYIDMKNSLDVVYFLSKWAKENEREFYHFTPADPKEYNNPFVDGQSSYDPLAFGTSSSKVDLLLNLREWDTQSDVYQKRTLSILQSVFFLMDEVDRDKVQGIDWKSGGLIQFLTAMRPESLRSMIMNYQEKLENSNFVSQSDKENLSAVKELYDALNSKSRSDLKTQAEGLVANVRTLIQSSYGRWLVKGERNIDLLKVSRSTEKNPPVVLFSMTALSDEIYAKSIGEVLLKDLSRVVAEKNTYGDKNLFGVYIDEYQTLSADGVKGILEKSRSAGIFVTLSMQSVEQLAAENAKGNEIINSIIDTCQNFIIHAGSNSDAAEKFSKILGKMEVKSYRPSTNMSSSFFSLNWGNTRNARIATEYRDEWILDSKKIQKLSVPKKKNKFKATAYYIAKSVSDQEFAGLGRGVARIVHVVVNKDLIEGVPKEFVDEYNRGATSSMQSKRLEDDIHNTQEESTFEKISLPPTESLDKRLADKEIEEIEKLRSDLSKKKRPAASENQPKPKTKSGGLPKI